MSVELPPLPEPAWKWTEQPMNLQRILGGRPPYPIYGFHSEDQMRAYARAAVDAALEAAAVKCDEFVGTPAFVVPRSSQADADSARTQVAMQAAAAIRSMRSGVENI